MMPRPTRLAKNTAAALAALALCALAPRALANEASAPVASAPDHTAVQLHLPPLAPDLFPGSAELAPEQVLARGLAQSFPGRVFEGTLPTLAAGPAEALRRPLGAKGEFIRVGSAAQAVAALASSMPEQTLVLDLRRCTSELADALSLGALLAGKPVSLGSRGAVPPPSAGETPSATRPSVRIVLVGPATSGPLEAVLDHLAADGAVITVGGATSGRTGYHAAREGFPGWQFLVGEHLGADGRSLLGTGITPLIPVSEHADDDAAYDALSAGATIEAVTRPKNEKPRFGEAELLRSQARNRNGNRSPAEPAAEEGTATQVTKEDAPIDSTLQRALGIVTALEALDRMPKRGN